VKFLKIFLNQMSQLGWCWSDNLYMPFTNVSVYFREYGSSYEIRGRIG